jgi:hypothetical protein
VELDGLGGDLAGNKGGKWVAASEKGNEKPGRYYGPNFATCKLDSAMVGCVFFPASGARNYTNGGIIVQGSVGHGWSSMQSAPANGYALLLNVTTTYAAIGLTKAYGLTIRCVQ